MRLKGVGLFVIRNHSSDTFFCPLKFAVVGALEYLHVYLR